MKSWRAQLPFILIACLLTIQGAYACLWDSDTIKDELASKDADIFELISNQFPEHGEAYYKQRVKAAVILLGKDTSDVVARNDLGAAYTKLGEYDKALAVFTTLDRDKPNTYETLSNLGVLHKKMGKFDKAAEYIARALKIKPEGHMGLGDWYLQMLRYQNEVSKTKEAPISNFLGMDYGDESSAWQISSEMEKRFGDRALLEKQLKALIRNDRHFPDSYVVLGDLLRPRGSQAQLNLAFWCYLRAHDLGHKNPKMLMARMKGIHEHWSKAVNNSSSGNHVVSFEETLKDIRGQLKKRENWLKNFKKIEAEMIGKGQEVDFKAVKEELAKREIKVEGPKEAGIKPRTATQIGQKLGMEGIAGNLVGNMILIASVLLVLAILYKALGISNKTTRSEKETGKN